MDISSDYKDLFKVFRKNKVKYLVVGAYAVIFYSEPRFTKDLDVWVKPDMENARKVYKALSEFGAPLKDVSFKTFVNKDMVYQIGIAPVRIDIIIGLGGVDFDYAWKRRKISKYDDVPINIIGLNDLIKSKKAARRKQDEVDLDILRRAKKIKHRLVLRSRERKLHDEGG